MGHEYKKQIQNITARERQGMRHKGKHKQEEETRAGTREREGTRATQRETKTSQRRTKGKGDLNTGDMTDSHTEDTTP